MKKAITDFYQHQFQVGYYLISTSIFSIGLGIPAGLNWGMVGKGILLIFGSFGLYQAGIAIWILFSTRRLLRRKVHELQQQQIIFIRKEIKSIEQKQRYSKNWTTVLMVAFLYGVLLLLMGAFGGWNELSLGLGAGLSLQAAMMLSLNLMTDFRRDYYLLKLRKS